MAEEHHSSSELSRRELLRRAALATMATVAAGGVYGLSRRASYADTKAAIPLLDAPGRVRGLARRGDTLVAVVEVGETPTIWTHRAGDSAWSLAAGPQAFPDGAGLASVTTVDGQLFAAGSLTKHVDLGVATVEAHARTEPLRPARPGDRSQRVFPRTHGQPMTIDAHVTQPAVFSSLDGSRWEVALGGLPRIAGGAFSAITAVPGGGVLAVGSEFPEIDVAESSGTLAAFSANGRFWERVDLMGVVDPQHGDITLLAQVRDQLLLGTTGLGSAELYVRTGTGSWQRIPAPQVEGPVSFAAAGLIDGRIMLAGIDHLDEARFWQQSGDQWVETAAPSGLGAGSKVVELEAVDGDLVAAGSIGNQTLVRTIGGSR